MYPSPHQPMGDGVDDRVYPTLKIIQAPTHNLSTNHFPQHDDTGISYGMMIRLSAPSVIPSWIVWFTLKRTLSKFACAETRRWYVALA